MVERKEAEEEALLAWSASPLAVREQLGKWKKKLTLSGIPDDETPRQGKEMWYE